METASFAGRLRRAASYLTQPPRQPLLVPASPWIHMPMANLCLHPWTHLLSLDRLPSSCGDTSRREVVRHRSPVLSIHPYQMRMFRLCLLHLLRRRLRGLRVQHLLRLLLLLLLLRRRRPHHRQVSRSVVDLPLPRLPLLQVLHRLHRLLVERASRRRLPLGQGRHEPQCSARTSRTCLRHARTSRSRRVRR